MKKSRQEKIAKQLKYIIDGIVNETLDIPDNAIIMDTEVMMEIITKKRLELVNYINKFKPGSVQELADLVHRRKQAVDRDLKLLEAHELVTLHKEGRKVRPVVNRRFLMMEIAPTEA